MMPKEQWPGGHANDNDAVPQWRRPQQYYEGTAWAFCFWIAELITGGPVSLLGLIIGLAAIGIACNIYIAWRKRS